MHIKNVILTILILQNLEFAHASYVSDINLEADHQSQIYSNFVTKIDQIDTIKTFLYQVPSLYEDPVFNSNEAYRALLTGKINDQIVDKNLILDLYYKESITKSPEIQEKLYSLLTKPFGTLNFINSIKADELLNIALSQKQTWAYRQQAMIHEEKGNEKSALRYYILEAHRDDSQSKKKVNSLLGYNPNTITLHPKSSLQEKKLFIKKWEKLGYGIPLYDYFHKHSQTDNNFFDSFFLNKSADLGHVMSKFLLADYHLNLGDYKKSLSLFSEAADEGHKESQVQTAQLLYNRFKNKKKSLEYYKKAAKQGFVGAQYNLGHILSEGFEDQNPSDREALKFFLQAARQDYLPAIKNTASLLLAGFEEQPSNPKEALYWFKKAAEKDDEISQLKVGDLLYFGFEGQASNLKEALYWLKRAAEKGNEFAQFNVGEILRQGYDDVEPNREQALNYYLQAAKKEYPHALYNIGLMLAEERNSSSYQKALKYFKRVMKAEGFQTLALYNSAVILRRKTDRQASDNLQAYQCFSKTISDPNFDEKYKSQVLIEMGRILEEGFTGQKPDPEKALQCYLEAARKNSARAQHIVATSYLKQDNNSLNNEAALDFLLQAAQQDYTPAMITLADYYMIIEDKPKESLFWLEKAQSLKEPLADKHLKFIESLHLSWDNIESETQEKEIQDLLKTALQPKEPNQLDLLNVLKSENREQVQDVKSTETILEPVSNISIFPDSTPLKEKQEMTTLENPNDLSDDDFTDTFSQQISDLKDFSFAISNPKYVREQMKKMGDLKKSYKMTDESTFTVLDPKNQEIVEKLKNFKNNDFNFKDLEKLFKDPYFSGQAIMYETRSGKMISAHNKVTGDHLTISTHRGHFKNVDHDISKAFIANISKILKIFNL